MRVVWSNTKAEREQLVKEEAVPRVPLFADDDPVVAMFHSVPFCVDWVEYEGETWVGQFNFEESMKTGKPMIDLSICMTRALNQCIVATVPYEPGKFTPSPIGHWGNPSQKP